MTQQNAQATEQTSTQAQQPTQPATLTDMLPKEQLDKAAYYMYHGIIPERYEGNLINGLETFLKRAEKHEKDYDELGDNPDLLKKVLKKHKIECPKYDLFPATLPSYGFGEVFYPTIGVDMGKLKINGESHDGCYSLTHTIAYKKLRASLVFHDGKNGSHIMPLTRSIRSTAWDLYLDNLIANYEYLKKFIKEKSQPQINLKSGGDFPVYDANNPRINGILRFGEITIDIPQFDEPKCILEMLSFTRNEVKGEYDKLSETNLQRLYRTWNTQKKIFLMTAAGEALAYTFFPSSSMFDILFHLVGYFAVLHGTYPLTSSYALRRRIQQFNKDAEAVEKMALFCNGFDEFDKLMRLLPRIHPKDAHELSEEITQGETLKTLADVVDEKAKIDWRYKVIAKHIDFHKCTKDEHAEGNHTENEFDPSLN